MLELLFAISDMDVGQVTKASNEIVASIPHWEMPHEFFVDFAYTDIPVRKGNITVEVGPGVYFNHAYPWNWLMHVNNRSYIQVTPVLTKEQAEKKWNLILSHLSALPGRSPISIEVNGNLIAHGFQPYVDAWREDYFPVDLHEGTNTIKIKLLDADTNYWIQKLYIDPIE